MADVAVSEPAQSLMSIVRQDGPEDAGGTALIPSSRQPARKTRLRKVRPPDLKGGRATKEKTRKNTAMASKPPAPQPPHRDYLSEQRAKRMEKLKAKERHDGSRRSLGRARAEETKGEGDVERPDAVVEETEEIAAEAEEEEEGPPPDELVKEVERPTGDGEEPRGASAGSDVSKDEGISSNGEKDEEFESEVGDGGGKVGDAGPVDDIDDDEGRGSIKDEAEEDEELSSSPHSGEVEEAAETEAAVEVPAADDVGDDATSKPDLENGDEDSDPAAIAQEGEQEEEEGDEVQPDTENVQEPETTDMVSHAGETEEHADDGAERDDEEKTHYIEDDAAGYQGDMDEPNSLAASYQGSLGLSSDAGLGTTADTSVLRSTLEEMQTGTWEEEETEAAATAAGEEPTDQEKEEDNILMEEAEEEEPQPKETEEEEQTKADEEGEEEKEEEETIDKDTGEGEEVKVVEEPEEEEEEEEEEKDQEAEEAETLEEQQEITHVGEEEEKEEKRDTETEKLEERVTEDAEPEGEAEGTDELEQAGQEDDVDAEVDAEADQVDKEDALSRVVEEEEEIEGEDGQGRDAGAGADDDEEDAVNDGEEVDATQEQGMEDITEEGEKDDQESEGEKDSLDGEEPKISSEVEPEGTEAPDDGVVEGESEDTSESQEPEREEEEREEGEQKDDDEEVEEDEEIKEVPAIARIPGRYRGRRNQTQRPPQIQEPEVRKTPRNKPYDRSKVMANRKPISWRPTPIQASGQPEVGKLRNDKAPNNKFKARNLTLEDQNGTAGEGEEPATHEDENGERDPEGGQRDRSSGEFLDLPPVNIPTSDDGSIVLESFRSEGHLSQADSQVDEDSQVVPKAESLPDVRYQDITRPNTAGKRGKTRRRRKVKSRVASTPSKPSGPQQVGRSTSEVWVPHEDKLYVYTYSSQPRLLHVRRMGAGRVATTHQWDQDPNSSFRLKTRGNGNPMYDRRVVRGSNYAKRLGSDEPPKWNPYFTNARSLEQQENPDPASQNQQQHLRRQEFREKLEARARLRRESHGVSSLYPSHGGASHHHPHRSYARVHAQVQTENHYEPLERPPEAEAEVQTEPWGEEGTMPPVVFQTPRGVDADTQVYDSELDADDEEDVLVAALVRRTMHEAVLEVAQEEQAEEDRINRIAASSYPSFLKPAEKTEDVQEDRGKAESTEEERKDPDGKETSPEDTEEPARSPEVAAAEEAAGEVKEIHLITAVEAAMSPVPVAHDAVQESQSLVI